jgi:hypothetical protein
MRDVNVGEWRERERERCGKRVKELERKKERHGEEKKEREKQIYKPVQKTKTWNESE